MSGIKLPPSYKDPKIFNNKFIIKNQISSGSFGTVYLAFDKNTKEEIAIKLEKDDDEICTLDREVIILQRIDGVDGVPKLFWSGFEQDYNVMVLQLLGKDLAHYMKQHKRMSLKTGIQIGQQLVKVMQNVHDRGVVHRDLKPENLLVGKDDVNKIYMVDYGVSKIYVDSHKNHVPFRDKKSFIGTTRYASIAAHKGYEIGRKDDVESLFYVLIYLVRGKLPWQNLQNIGERDRTEVVGEVKVKTEIQDLCKDLPTEFTDILNYLKKLEFMQEPNYEWIQQQLKQAASLNSIKLDNQFEWSPKSIMNASQGGLQIPNAQDIRQSSHSVKNQDKLKDQPLLWSVNNDQRQNQLKPPETQNLLIPDRKESRNPTNSSLLNSIQGITMKFNQQKGSYSSMQIKYIPSHLENSSYVADKKEKKEESKQQTPFVLNSMPDYDVDKKLVLQKKKTLDSTWGYRQEEMEEYTDDSPKLADKYSQLKAGSISNQIKHQNQINQLQETRIKQIQPSLKNLSK